MPNRFRDVFLALLAATAVAACSSEMEASGCRSDDQCPLASRCRTGTCVADGKPVATIRPLASVEAFALVQLDGSASSDPDDDDGVARHLWSVRSLTAPCDPPEIAGVQPIAHVRFGCPGRYEVSLAVRDNLGVESAPATAQLDVVAATGRAAVSAGPDVATDHSCTGDPLVCRPTSAVPLSASTSVPGLTLHWSVEPPLDRPLDDGTRRVWLGRGTTAAGTAAAFIETDGTAISGDWIFRVEARDAYGVVGAAYTRVSVRNRPPVFLVAAPSPFPHAYDPAGARFTSSGELAWSAIDPDGDPLEIEATWRHVGDGGATFGGELAAGRATFAVEVPHAIPSDALLLRGGPELARSIDLVARDPNRGEGGASVAVEIGNRPPVPAGGVVDARVPHVFDAQRSRYVAHVGLGAWMDPDGDPLSAGPGIAPCDAVSVAGGIARAECSVAYEGTPAVERLAGRRSVSAPVRDPWNLTPVVPIHGVDVLNSPPSLALASARGQVCAHVFDSGWVTTCRVDATELVASPVVADPDGDPVLVSAMTVEGGSATPERAVCTAGDCVQFRFFEPKLTGYCDPANLERWVPKSRLLASDGAALAAIAVSPVPTICP